MLKSFDVSLQTWLPLFLLTRVTIQNTVMAEDAAFHFVEPDLVSILHRLRFLATHNDIGMFFKDTDDLFFCRHLFTLQDPTDGLLDYLSGKRDEVIEGFDQSLCTALRLFLQLLLGLKRPVNGLLGYLH